MDSLPHVLYILCGLAWTIAYILILRRGLLDRHAGIPLLAVAVNISWEGIYSFIYPLTGPLWLFSLLWFFIDLALIALVIAHGPWRQPIQNALALGMSIFVFIGILLYAEMYYIEPIRTAFAQNLMMSILFVNMLLTRMSSQGQSLYIALAKGIGTASAILIAWNGFASWPVMQVLFVLIVIFDLLYALLLHAQLRKDGYNPWARL